MSRSRAIAASARHRPFVLNSKSNGFSISPLARAEGTRTLFERSNYRPYRAVGRPYGARVVYEHASHVPGCPITPWPPSDSSPPQSSSPEQSHASRSKRQEPAALEPACVRVLPSNDVARKLELKGTWWGGPPLVADIPLHVFWWKRATKRQV